MNDDKNRTSRRGIGPGSGIPDPEPFGGTPDLRTKTEIEFPSMVLVCNDCNEYYEHDGEWSHCPKCGHDLVEVEQA